MAERAGGGSTREMRGAKVKSARSAMGATTCCIPSGGSGAAGGRTRGRSKINQPRRGAQATQQVESATSANGLKLLLDSSSNVMFLIIAKVKLRSKNDGFRDF